MHTRIHCAEIHSIKFNDGYHMFDSPARIVTRHEQVTDIYIRHFQGATHHLCRLALSPSITQASSSTSLAAESTIYVVVAACSRFKLYFNGKLVVEAADSGFKSRTVYGSHVRVSQGGVFAFSSESCGDFKGFVGCFGSSSCTGHNDDKGWFCARSLPPDGWMLPSYRTDAIDEVAKPPCSIKAESDIWSIFSPENTDHQCIGLAAFPAANDSASCARACCADSSCARFQWCGGGDCNTTSVPTKCWIGVSAECRRQLGWVSGIRNFRNMPMWNPARSLGPISAERPLDPGLDNKALWLSPAAGHNQEEQLRCRWAL